MCVNIDSYGGTTYQGREGKGDKTKGGCMYSIEDDLTTKKGFSEEVQDSAA